MFRSISEIGRLYSMQSACVLLMTVARSGMEERKRVSDEQKRELEEYEDIIEDLTQTVRTVASKVHTTTPCTQRWRNA
jgi:hypothetical protein